MPQPPSPTIMKKISFFGYHQREGMGQEKTQETQKKPQNNSKQVFILEIEWNCNHLNGLVSFIIMQCLFVSIYPKKGSEVAFISMKGLHASFSWRC